MNVADPYYIGALPSVGAFVVGLAILLFAGWLVGPRKK